MNNPKEEPHAQKYENKRKLGHFIFSYKKNSKGYFVHSYGDRVYLITKKINHKKLTNY